MPDDFSGRELGKYELKERIGRGGMAEVYRAYHASLDRYVAIKILHPFLGDDPAFKERFEQEARNVAQLRHSNIVQVYDFEYDADRELYYMVMEYVNGQTLSTTLMQLKYRNELQPVSESVRIVRHLCDALAYAHSRGMIHRDIKPGNIMIDVDDRVVLTDFGIARIVSGPHITASGAMIGTPSYMAPEQGLGQPGDSRSDIYSLGIVLYQMLTGSPPYDADTPIAIVLKHVNDPLPPPSEFNDNIPSQLEWILYKALAKSPDDRYQTVSEMASHLDNLDAVAPLQPPAGSGVELSATLKRSATSDLGIPKLEPVHQKPGLVQVAGTSTPAVDAPFPRRGGCLLWLVLMLIALGATASGGYLSYNGYLSRYLSLLPEAAVVLTDTPRPPATPTFTAAPLETLAPIENVAATEIAQTLDALASLVATPLAETPTPDLTATIAACDYDYRVVSQNPANGTLYPELTTLTMELVIRNDSRCLLDADTRLVFHEGYQLQGPNFIAFDRALASGEEISFELDFRTPPYTADQSVVRSTWQIQLADGTRVGPPLVLVLDLFPSSTLQVTDEHDSASPEPFATPAATVAP